MNQPHLTKPKATYIKPSPGVTELLTTLRHGGKQLFLASNSNFDFVDVGMTFLVGSDWRARFDVVIVSADKPNFFSGKHRRPFRQVDPETGRPMMHKVHSLKSDGIYAAGGVESLAQMTGWGAGDVLYCGDSLWADLVEAHRRNGWHTAAIINELEDELKVIESPEYHELLLKAATLEELLRVIQEEVFRLPYFHDGAVEKLPRRTSADDRLIDAVESILKDVKEKMRVIFNTQFGSVFRARHGPTLFASSLYRHCDLYTARLENLNSYPNVGMRRFYPTASRPLPHEKIVSNGRMATAIKDGGK